MIQFNLLPDIKLEYIKTQKMKHRVVTVAIAAALASLTILVMLVLVVYVVQKQHLKHLNNDIKRDVAALQAIPDLDKVLTIQNQLQSLPGLHDDKPVASRFLGFLSQLTPSAATVSNAKIDFESNTISISGDTNSLSVVNQYVDTLKFTEYSVSGSDEKKLAFSEVVLSQFGKSDKGVTYKIDFKFDPEIFNGTKEVKLEVPNIVSTRSTTEKPTELFQQNQNSTGGQ